MTFQNLDKFLNVLKQHSKIVQIIGLDESHKNEKIKEEKNVQRLPVL